MYKLLIVEWRRLVSYAEELAGKQDKLNVSIILCK